MRRIFVHLICLLVIAVACKKTADPTLTAEDQLNYDINLIDEYLAKHNIEAIKLESGVRYVITEMGDGPIVTKDNCIRYRFSAYQLSDSVAYSSNTTDGIKAPFKTRLGGLQIALKLFPVGTKGMIYMPSAYAYGAGGVGDGVGGYAVLPSACIWYDLEVMQIYGYNAEGNYCYEQ